MISKLEHTLLKDVLKSNYTAGVLAVLKGQNSVKKNGKPYSAKYVRAVFQGRRQNTTIEKAIWQLASLRKEQETIQKELKESITKTGF